MQYVVKETRRETPVRVVLFGAGGVGKSSVASQAPNPIFIASEEGLGNIDARAVEPYPSTWEDVQNAIEFVGTLDHETIVIDSIDQIEPLIWAHVCRAGKKPDIEAFGFGKGYTASLDQWRLFLHKLSALRVKGMNIILVAHGHRKMFKNPLGDDYEHWTIKLHEKAAGLIVEWADIVGYCCEDIATDDTSGRVKAQTTGKRIIRTNPHPAYLAKTRFSLPPKLPLTWAALAAGIKAGGPAKIASLKEALEGRIQVLRDEEVESKVRAYLRETGITELSLVEAIERLDVTINERKAS